MINITELSEHYLAANKFKIAGTYPVHIFAPCPSYKVNWGLRSRLHRTKKAKSFSRKLFQWDHLSKEKREVLTIEILSRLPPVFQKGFRDMYGVKQTKMGFGMIKLALEMPRFPLYFRWSCLLCYSMILVKQRGVTTSRKNYCCFVRV